MNEPTNRMPPMTPYLTMTDTEKGIEFSNEVFRLTLPDSGKVCHAELILNDGRIMLGEEHPGITKSPATLNGTSVRICLMVDDVDAWIDRSIKAGATVTIPAQNYFYGHRSGSIRDPFGHEWMLNHEIEKVETAEMQRRWKEMVTRK